jgi:hypothetical protein
MNPRAVQMAKAIAEYNSGSINTGLLGNILAPFLRGWTNNSVNYFTFPENIQVDPGTPFAAQPCVYSYTDTGAYRYRWFPVRPSNIWWTEEGGFQPTKPISAIIYCGVNDSSPTPAVTNFEATWRNCTSLQSFAVATP